MSEQYPDDEESRPDPFDDFINNDLNYGDYQDDDNGYSDDDDDYDDEDDDEIDINPKDLPRLSPFSPFKRSNSPLPFEPRPNPFSSNKDKDGNEKPPGILGNRSSPFGSSPGQLGSNFGAFGSSPGPFGIPRRPDQPRSPLSSGGQPPKTPQSDQHWSTLMRRIASPSTPDIRPSVRTQQPQIKTLKMLLLLSLLLNLVVVIYGQHYREQSLVQEGRISELRYQIEAMKQAE